MILQLTSEIAIIFEDGDLLCIDKPAGLIVNRADTTKGVETVQEWVEERYQISNIKSYGNDVVLFEEFISRSGIVHRLDKDTSGVLVIAKTPESFKKLKIQFQDRTTVKKYLALVHGLVEPLFGRINVPIERSPYNRMRFGVFPGGREAVTDYQLIKSYEARVKNDKKEMETLSLLEVTPHTGRTHQIRVHLKHINHPVVCDPIYGGRKQYHNDQKIFPRLFLHAKSLQIKHPMTNETMTLIAELPKDLAETLEQLIDTKHTAV